MATRTQAPAYRETGLEAPEMADVPAEVAHAGRVRWLATQPPEPIPDAWVFHPRLANVVDLARAFPDTTIILGHVGGVLGYGPYADKQKEVYIETCIELFGADRCLFESNFPVDKMGIGWAGLWNALKRLAGGAAVTEKQAMFSGTARRVYRLDA